MFTYTCIIDRVIDGDTVDVDIDLGFGIWIHKERIRLAFVDTPESRTSDTVEKAFGLYAKDYVESAMPAGTRQTLIVSKNSAGKYGRYLGEFILEDGVSLNRKLIAEGVGVEYTGQSKDEIKLFHLLNRKRLIKEGKMDIYRG